MSDFETIEYERPAEKVARIVLNRPEARNAQSVRMLYERQRRFRSCRPG